MERKQELTTQCTHLSMADYDGRTPLHSTHQGVSVE
ncbi:hypothetical protein R3I94_011656 [Phoxinus phoxinus]